MADNEPARWFVQDPWVPLLRRPDWWPMADAPAGTELANAPPTEGVER